MVCYDRTIIFVFGFVFFNVKNIVISNYFNIEADLFHVAALILKLVFKSIRSVLRHHCLFKLIVHYKSILRFEK